MNEYASLLGDAVLRQRTRTAEHTARLEAELAGKVKSEFISNMSHELRTPLNTVIGFSKILAEQDKGSLEPRDVVEYATLIHDAAVHLLAVVNDILDISKIQSGRYTLDSREIDISALLSAEMAALSGEASKAQVAVSFAPPSDLPFIRGDDKKLAQVFANILSNAIKFTRAGGNVTVEAASLANGAVAIFVRDSGVGMTPEELKIALQPFGQVDGSRTRWREGTGLGLTIARSLVELHGGTLEINSEKNVGTEVVIRLPSRHEVAMTQAAQQQLPHA